MIPFAIGTAQFGQAYGICNKGGAVESSAAREIVDLALLHGIDFFDTARLYGESEFVLGSALPVDKDTRIITKSVGDPARPEKIPSDFEVSLRHLRQKSLYAVLIHNVQSLLGKGGAQIWSELKLLKDKGLVQKIGVSVYAPDEFIELVDRFDPDIVQMPCNLLDQSFLRCDVQMRKKDKNIEFHARSLFLQGIILNLPGGIPPFMNHRRDLFEKISIAASGAGMTMLEFCLSFARSCADNGMIDRWVIGVDSQEQLSGIVNSAKCVKAAPFDWAQFGTDAIEIIDPRQWKKETT